MKPPAWFISELAAFDPELRIRWSQRRQLFQLERKIRNSLPIEPRLNNTEHDDYIRAREGYILVGSIPANSLSRRVFEVLRQSDLYSRGGWERVLREIEAGEALQEQRQWEKFSRDMKDLSADVYEFLKLRNGQTIYNAGVK